MDPRIAEIEKESARSDLPAFAPGDTVRVRVRVVEGDKERVQPFEGICIARRGSGLNETFTLRRVSGGVGVERIFPINSPSIAALEVVRRGQVRRAKLYYLRARRGKRARVRERRWWLEGSGEAAAGPKPSEVLSGEEADQASSAQAEEEDTTAVEEELASGESEAGAGAPVEAQPESEADAEAGPRGRRRTAETAAE